MDLKCVFTKLYTFINISMDVKGGKKTITVKILDDILHNYIDDYTIIHV